jgi:ABC-type molybdate transport system substrate-binding protein
MAREPEEWAVRGVMAGWVLACLLVLGGCAMKPETVSRWPDASGRAEAVPGPGLAAVRVAVDPALAALLRGLEPLYEGARPGVDLVIYEGARTGRMDQSEWLAMRLERGAQADVYVSESGHGLDELTRTPAGSAPWLGNTLAVVVPRGSQLDRRELALRRAPVHIALERTALGRWTRASLRESGLWGEVSLASGNIYGGAAIEERVAYFAKRPTPEESFGIVFGSDADASRVRVVGYLDQPRGDATIHHVAWFSEAGADLAQWLLSDTEARAAAARAGFVVAETAR